MGLSLVHARGRGCTRRGGWLRLGQRFHPVQLILPRNGRIVLLFPGVDGQDGILVPPQGLLVNDRGNIPTLGILQLIDHALDGGLVEVGQEQAHIVQILVHLDMALEGCPYHTAQKLCNVGGILGPAEGHHGFCPGAVPPGRQVLFEQYHPDALVGGNVRRLHMGDGQPVDGQRGGGAEGVYHLVFLKAFPQPLLDGGDHIVQVGVRNSGPTARQHLNDKDRVDQGVVLLIGVLIPMGAFLAPLVRGGLQDGHVIGFLRVVRVGDHDAVFQQAGGSHLVGRHDALVQRGGGVAHKLVKPGGGGADPDDQRHRGKPQVGGALQKALHDGGGLACLLALHPPVGLIDDEIEPVGLLSGRVLQGLPYGILPLVRVLA